MCDCLGVEEQKPWKELPAMWSVPKAGELCHMSKLQPSDPEYMEVERNVRKTCVVSLKIVSVSEPCETSVHSLCHSSITDQVKLVSHVRQVTQVGQLIQVRQVYQVTYMSQVTYVRHILTQSNQISCSTWTTKLVDKHTKQYATTDYTSSDCINYAFTKHNQTDSSKSK